MSMSGAQFKVLLYLDEHGQPARPMGSAPATHILKPDIQRADIKAFASSINESLVMRTAALCELPTAPVTYQHIAQACLVERYDRVRQPDGSFLADARAQLEDVVATVGPEFEIGNIADEVDTLAGYVMNRVGRLPSRGEVVPGPGDFEIEVLDSDPRRLKKVRITRSKSRLERSARLARRREAAPTIVPPPPASPPEPPSDKGSP